MTILGIDPGLRLTGYAVLRRGVRTPTLLDAGVIRLDAKTPIGERLVELRRELAEIIAEHSPDACAIEEVFSHYNHPKTAVLMAHARGVILCTACEAKLSIIELSPNRVKQATVGHGHASKSQMQHAVQRMYKLAELPDPPDVADAIAIATAALGQNV